VKQQSQGGIDNRRGLIAVVGPLVRWFHDTSEQSDNDTHQTTTTTTATP